MREQNILKSYNSPEIGISEMPLSDIVRTSGKGNNYLSDEFDDSDWSEL